VKTLLEIDQQRSPRRKQNRTIKKKKRTENAVSSERKTSADAVVTKGSLVCVSARAPLGSHIQEENGELAIEEGVKVGEPGLEKKESAAWKSKLPIL